MLTEKKAIRAAIRSINEWIASDIILTDPLISPAMTFSIIRKVLETIESLATLTFTFIKWPDLLQK